MDKQLFTKAFRTETSVEPEVIVLVTILITSSCSLIDVVLSSSKKTSKVQDSSGDSGTPSMPEDLSMHASTLIN